MKKKQVLQEERPKQTLIQSKSKKTKLNDISNVQETHKKNQTSQSKSLKSIKKSQFCTLQTAKKTKLKNQSIKISSMGLESFTESNRTMEHIQQKVQEKIKNTSMIDTLLKGKLSTMDSENKYLMSMNEELKNQISRAQENIIQLNRNQGVLRQEIQSLNIKYDSQLQKQKMKEEEYREKIRILNKNIQILKQVQNKESQDLLIKKQQIVKETQLLAFQKSKLLKQNQNLKEEKEQFVKKLRTQKNESIKHIGELELQIQQVKGKMQQTKRQSELFAKNIGTKLGQMLTTPLNDNLTLPKNIEKLLQQLSQNYADVKSQNKMLNSVFQQRQKQRQQSFMRKYQQMQSQNQILRNQLQKMQNNLPQNTENQTILIMQKKITQTRTSLQYWKKKFDECKLQNMKLKKDFDLQQEEIKISETNFKVLQSERQKQKIIFNQRQKVTSIMERNSIQPPNFNQKLIIQQLKSQIQKLQNEKNTMAKEGAEVSEKLKIFKKKVMSLQQKLGQIRQNKDSKYSIRESISSSFVFNNYSTVVSNNQSQLTNSQYYTNNSQHNTSTQRSNSKNIRQYKGDTQSKLQEQFSRCNKFILNSPEKQNTTLSFTQN